MPRIAYYPGSFDPVTNGHVDVVRQACHLVDKLIVAIGTPLRLLSSPISMLRDPSRCASSGPVSNQDDANIQYWGLKASIGCRRGLRSRGPWPDGRRGRDRGP